MKDPRKVRDISFRSATGSDVLFCKEWMPEYFYFMSLKFGAPLVIIGINLIVPIVFGILGGFEHALTKTEQTERTESARKGQRKPTVAKKAKKLLR